MVIIWFAILTRRQVSDIVDLFIALNAIVVKTKLIAGGLTIRLRPNIAANNYIVHSNDRQPVDY